jgi:CHAT domain-containing protein
VETLTGEIWYDPGRSIKSDLLGRQQLMRCAGVCLISLLSLVLSASNPRHVRPTRPPSPDVRQILTAARALAAEANYDAAVSLYETELSRQTSSNNRIPLLIGAGNCRLAKQQYSEALRLFAEADTLARTSGMPEYRITIANNRASLYRRMGDLSGALAAIREVENPLSDARKLTWLVQVASLQRDIDFGRSVPIFESAIRLSSELGDMVTEALAWQHLGHGYLKHGDLANAEEALTNGFRLRVLNGRRQLQSCYFYLGQLRRLQGRFREALTLLSHARELAGRPGAHIPVPYVHYELALANRDLHDLASALEEFKAAADTARELRSQFLTSETFRASAEASLQQIFSDYVRAGMQYARQTGNAAITRQMLEVSEESRAVVFESTLNSSRDLPPEYRQLLTRYQRALARSVSEKQDSSTGELSALRVQLADLESRFSARKEHRKNSHQKNERSGSGGALEDLQRKLKSTEAVLSFHAGADESYLWALTSHSFEAHSLPGNRALSELVTAFRNQLRAKDAAWRSSGENLRSALLDRLSPSVASKPDWILSLDGPFFELPFGALPLPPGSELLFLGQQHSLRTVPGIFLAAGEGPQSSDRSAFAAFADARYNTADPRWGRERPKVLGGQQLARLPGTALEADACARAWGRDPRPEILRGPNVNRAAVMAAISQQPAVLHLAAHVLPHPQSPDQVLIALGLQQDGIADYLGPSDITSMHSSIGLVTLSGCGSASGKALPGVGLFGLTRAWLVSGAAAVVATHWPMADGSGEILMDMYAVLRENPGPVTAASVAKALQNARIRMMQFRDWRSDPGYWGAFMVAGKD